jgi:hypothetical protein
MGPSDQLMTNSGGWHSFLAVSSEKARTRKPRPCKHFHSKAGDRIRTDDVQLGMGGGNEMASTYDLGDPSLVSCLVLLCRHPSLVRLVEAWPQLTADQKRQILAAAKAVGPQ